MPVWPFPASREMKDADLLLQRVTGAGRNPALFGEGRAPDTLDGRFELISLYAGLALQRLRQSPEAEPLAQAFVDALFKQLDAGLREEGVGDLAVPKRVHKLAGVFYARLEAYSRALEAHDVAALREALVRNLLGTTSSFAETLAARVCDLAAAQTDLPWQALMTAEGWPAFAA
jgi:cytochrome b pre-mRNA-processing protein 3